MFSDERKKSLLQKKAELQQILSAEPHDASAQMQIGNIFLRLKQIKENEESFKKIFRKTKNIAETHLIMSEQMLEAERDFDALFHAKKAVSFSNTGDNLSENILARCFVRYRAVSIDNEAYADLLRLLDNENIDAQPLVLAILSILKRKYPFDISHIHTNEITSDPLFISLLKNTIITDAETENLLVNLRHRMLFFPTRRWGAFCCAMAMQCFNNEYVFPETKEESKVIEKLQKLALSLEAEDLAVLASYRPLYSIDGSLEIQNKDWSENFKYVVTKQITEPEIEKKLIKAIASLTEITDKVSLKVQAQYEKSPYPRWVQKPQTNFEFCNKKLNILIAGCGTGQHSIELALRYKKSSILAIDLSKTSLAYAVRKTKSFGIKNIKYAQADILALGNLKQRFDIIECTGVLHHMKNPEEGLRILTNLLKSNGVINIGLYSKIGRQNIVKARKYITEKGYASSDSDIRQCRQDIIKDSSFNQLLESDDFYSLGTCRDMLFHVQEQRFSLEEIADMLDMLKLKFTGFDFVSHETFKKYIQKFPKDKKMRSLSNWEKFERENHFIFAGMYRFSVKKKISLFSRFF